MFQFAEGFDSIDQLSQSFDLVQGASSGLASPVYPINNYGDFALGNYGRFSSGGMMFITSSSVGAYLAKNLVGSPSTVIVGFAFNAVALPSSDQTILYLWDGQNSLPQLDFRISSTGNIKVTCGNTLLGTSSTAVAAGVWNYLEFKAKIDPTTGSVEVRLNGVDIINLTGINTRYSSASQVTQVGIGYFANSNNWHTGGNSGELAFDDLYICDGTGASLNDFLGDVAVRDQRPTGAGAYTQMAPNGAATNYLAVRDTFPDDDQSFVASATAGQKDTYQIEAMAASAGTVVAVVGVLRARKDDSNTHTLGCVCRSGSTDSLNSNQPVLTATYQDYQFCFPTDPAGGNWTVASVNAAQIGPQVVS